MSEWESDADYNKVKAFVSTVKVVNDCAERAVALATDYYKVSIIYFTRTSGRSAPLVLVPVPNAQMLVTTPDVSHNP